MSTGFNDPNDGRQFRRQAPHHQPMPQQQVVDPISRLIAIQEETLDMQRQILDLEKVAAEERQTTNKHLARLRQAITPIEVAAWIVIVGAAVGVFVWFVNAANG